MSRAARRCCSSPWKWRRSSSRRVFCPSRPRSRCGRSATASSSESEWEKFVLTMQDLSTLPLYIDDTGGISIAQIAARARRLKREKNIGLIIIDYLQLVEPSRRHENRVQEITEVTKGLKTLAKELNVPVLALSQLSRGVDARDDKRPVLSDLRESGSIEQDADVVMFVYREEYYLKSREPDPAPPNMPNGWRNASAPTTAPKCWWKSTATARPTRSNCSSTTASRVSRNLADGQTTRNACSPICRAAAAATNTGSASRCCSSSASAWPMPMSAGASAATTFLWIMVWSRRLHDIGQVRLDHSAPLGLMIARKRRRARAGRRRTSERVRLQPEWQRSGQQIAAPGSLPAGAVLIAIQVGFTIWLGMQEGRSRQQPLRTAAGRRSSYRALSQSEL